MAGRAVVVITLMASVAALASIRLLAQSPAPADTSAHPTFDVVSVKSNRSGERLIRLDTPGGRRFVATNVPVRALIRLSYGLGDFQISGGPSWMESERFDVVANAAQDLPSSVMAGPVGPLHLMVRAMLAERFGLVTHTELRQSSIYRLVVSRDGRPREKFRKSSTDCAALFRAATPQTDPPDCGLQAGPGFILAEGMPMSQLAVALSGALQRSVIDTTGLDGTYDLELDWQQPSVTGAAGTPTDSGVGPSLFTALQEQAGLKLDPAKGPVSVLVVDKLEHPTAD